MARPATCRPRPNPGKGRVLDGVDLGKQIIRDSKLNVIPADDLNDAAAKIVKAVKEAA